MISFAVTAFMLGIIYRTWVLARQDEIQDDVEDRRVAATPSFDAEDDADPGSKRPSSRSRCSARRQRTMRVREIAPRRTIPRRDAAAEEATRLRNVDLGTEGGGK